MTRKLLLENINVPGINTFDVYRQNGGYRSVEKALKTMSTDDVVEEVKKSGLRGRGGAGFPTGMKWSFLAKPEGKARYLVCNADESEPGTFKDRYLMTYLPHLLIEGMIVSSYALGAGTSFIYVRGEMMPQIRILEKQLVGCDDVAELLGEYVDGELSSTLSKRVGSHLKGCESCREIEEGYRFTIELAREIKRKPMPAGVQNRLRKALNERLGLNLSMID